MGRKKLGFFSRNYNDELPTSTSASSSSSSPATTPENRHSASVSSPSTPNEINPNQLLSSSRSSSRRHRSRSSSPNSSRERWWLDQVLSDSTVGPTHFEEDDSDFVTAIDFSPNGDLLAVGDRVGRVWVYAVDKQQKNCRYSLYVSFQSHEPELDYLKSLEIVEKINMIRWCTGTNSASFLLTTNDKIIKLWKIHSRRVTRISNLNFSDELSPISSSTLLDFSASNTIISSLRIPKLEHSDSQVTTSCKRLFCNVPPLTDTPTSVSFVLPYLKHAHAYHINAISMSSDEETFLSADDLRINLWNLDMPGQIFNMLDIKPDNMEELAEVITASQFHPINCAMFMYSSSRGTIRMMDLRQKALCESPCQVFEVEENPANRSHFSEIISSISDIKFTKCGRFVASRDFMTIKLWDIAMANAPVDTVAIHDFITPHLSDLYENEYIFDKFELCCDGYGRHVMSGSYDGNIAIYDRESDNIQLFHTPPIPPFTSNNNAVNEIEADSDASIEMLEPAKITSSPTFESKVLHTSWHPNQTLLACSIGSQVYVYRLNKTAQTSHASNTIDT